MVNQDIFFVAVVRVPSSGSLRKTSLQNRHRGTPRIDHALDQQTQEQLKAREQALRAAISDAAEQAHSSFFQRDTRRFTKAGYERYTATRPAEKCYHGRARVATLLRGCYWDKIDLTYIRNCMKRRSPKPLATLGVFARPRG